MRPQPIWRATMYGVLTLSLALLAQAVHGQQAMPTIFMNAVEYKGSTSTEKLAPPVVNPATLSKGYVLKAPGEADKTAPQVWEIDSYALTPGFVTVQQGDTVTLQVLVVNGDKHEVGVLAPDGQVVVPKATWTRGVEYRVSFVAEKLGTYKLSCETHAPTMSANILVLPR
jgi:plastocyanin